MLFRPLLTWHGDYGVFHAPVATVRAWIVVTSVDCGCGLFGDRVFIPLPYVKNSQKDIFPASLY
jgi:hypothetical protein